MSEIRLVLADLDGTVVQPEAQSASDNVITALRESNERGIKFAAITGRPYLMAKDLLKTIGFTDPCVFEGGATIINPATEEVLWSKTVPADTARRAVVILGKHASLIQYGQGVIRPENIDPSAVTEPVLSIWASVAAEDAEEVVADLKILPEVAVHSNNGPGGDFSRTGIQVTHFEADKEHAVRELLNLTGTDKQHTLAIGDGNNDLPLFMGAHLKVAMGNASDSLKAEADTIVGSVDDDGFAEAIRRFTM